MQLDRIRTELASVEVRLDTMPDGAALDWEKAWFIVLCEYVNALPDDERDAWLEQHRDDVFRVLWQPKKDAKNARRGRGRVAAKVL